MRIRIGSRVKFLNDVGGGIVKSFTDEKIALVETEDGFDMPVLITDLVVDESASYGMDGDLNSVNSESVPKNEPDKHREPVISFEEKKHTLLKGEVLIAVVPESEQVLHVSNFDLFIINDSNYLFDYVISMRDSGIYTHIESGIIESDSKLKIAQYSQTEIAKIKEFRLQGIYFKHGLFDPSQPVDLVFNIEEVSFYKINFFKENEYFNEKALILKKDEVDMKEALDKLTESDLAKVTRIKESEEKKPKSQPKKSLEIEEVDLHIEEIVDNHSGMSNGEIIEIQLGRFETALETALRSNVQKIVFIHGVGNGKLKYELREKLEKKYPDLNYQDASFKEYGYGATMIYLK